MCVDQEHVGGHDHGERIDEPVDHETAHMAQPTGQLSGGLEDAHRAEQDEESRRVLDVPHSAGQGAQHPSAHDTPAQDHQGAGEELLLGNVVVNGETVEGLDHARRQQRQHDLDRTVEQLSRPVLTSRQGGRVQRHEDQRDRLDRQTPQGKDQGVTQQECDAVLIVRRHRTAPSTSGWSRTSPAGSHRSDR